MQQTPATCTQIEAIGQGRVRVQLRSPIRPAPGQFVLAAIPGAPASNLPRRVIFPIADGPEGFAFELLPGDPLRPHLTPGAALDLIGPLGRGCDPSAARMLLVANLEPATLLPFLSPTRPNATLLLGRPYPMNALPPEIEVRSGHLPSLLADYAGWAERVIVHTTPNRDLVLLDALRATFAPERVRVLLAPVMPCGVGACQGCAVAGRRGMRWACVDGPLFTLADLAE